MFTGSPWRPSRREFSTLALALPWLPSLLQERKVVTTAQGEPQLVEPPGEPDESKQQRLAAIAAALAAGKTTTDAVLLDPKSNDLRPYPTFRQLIAKHAPTGKARITPKDEPGTALSATVRVVDRDGKPYAGVRVYAYQTSNLGWYAAEAPHVSGESGDSRFARLFSHGVTDARGLCELVTVHPAGYPRSDLPSHIHLRLEGRDQDERWTEIRFEDCPRMTPAVRAQSLREGFVVAPVATAADGSKRCTAEFRLPAS